MKFKRTYVQASLRSDLVGLGCVMLFEWGSFYFE